MRSEGNCTSDKAISLEARDVTSLVQVTGIAEGLAYLHRSGIAHGNLKGVSIKQPEKCYIYSSLTDASRQRCS